MPSHLIPVQITQSTPMSSFNPTEFTGQDHMGASNFSSNFRYGSNQYDAIPAQQQYNSYPARIQPNQSNQSNQPTALDFHTSAETYLRQGKDLLIEAHVSKQHLELFETQKLQYPAGSSGANFIDRLAARHIALFHEKLSDAHMLFNACDYFAAQEEQALSHTREHTNQFFNPPPPYMPLPTDHQ